MVMISGTTISTERVCFAVLAVGAALALWWGAPHARPLEIALSPHAELECAECHLRTTGAPGGGGELKAADRKCLECHTRSERGSALAAAFHGGGGGACSSCHSFHRPQELSAQGTRFPYEFGNATLQAMCSSCHVKGGRLAKLTDGHRDAAKTYHVAAEKLAGLSPSESCLRCHSKTGSDPALPQSAAAAPRFHEDATHPLGEPVSLGAATGGYSVRRSLDPRIVLFDGRIECQTCHAIADDVDDLLVRFEAKYDLCAGCHERHPSAGPSLAAVVRTP